MNGQPPYLRMIRADEHAEIPPPEWVLQVDSHGEAERAHIADASDRLAVPDEPTPPRLPDPPGAIEEADEIVEGEIVEEAEEISPRPRLLSPRMSGETIVLRPAPWLVTWVLSPTVTVAQGWHSWLVRAYDGLTFGVHRRAIRAAEAIGDQEALGKALDRKSLVTRERHNRLMDLPLLAVGLVKVALISLAGVLLVLFLLSVAVWATGVGGFGAVFSWVGGAIKLVLTLLAAIWTPLMVAIPLIVTVAAWREGRRRGSAPRWLATSADADVDASIDETTIARALGALRIAQINAYLKQGLPLQFITPARRDGRGTYAEIRLPLGVTAEEISRPEKRAALATGLYRATKEVWPTTGSEAGILKLWVADKGALAEGAGRYPLLADGVVDVFKGVPLGKTLRGDPIVAPLMERNTLTGGMPGQGKSTSARVIMSGAALDPFAELWIHVPDTNFDFELFKRRCARYVMGAEDEKVEEILYDLRELYAEVQERGQLLIDHQEPAVTRRLAEAGVGLHPLFYLLEEAHLAIQHKLYGKEISQLLIDIVKLGRKRGIHVIVSTQAPTKDSMPRDVTRNCSNGIAFAVGDHVANDALLGQGAYRGGHRATELIPGVDRGTAVCKGLTGERSDIVQVYFISIEKGNDQVTPIIDRSLATIAKRGTGIPGQGRRAATLEAGRDLLDDLDEVLGEDRVKLADVPALLRELAPAWPAYQNLNGKDLRDILTRARVKVLRVGGIWFIDPAEIRRSRQDREWGE